jgi:hypothetical protein
VFPITDTYRPPQLAVVDIGAMDLGADDPFARLHTLGLATLTGFEPIPEEFAKLQAKATQGRRYLAYAIGESVCHYVMSVYGRKTEESLAARYYARLTRPPSR